MRRWSSPDVPELPVTAPAAGCTTPASRGSRGRAAEGPARLYVCGITPVRRHPPRPRRDLPRLRPGHPGLARRRARGHYVQNVTDVDDPLLERAAGPAWTGASSPAGRSQLFRDDMEALRVLPPTDYVGAVESIPLVVDCRARCGEARRLRTTVDTDLDFGHRRPWFGYVSGCGPGADAAAVRRARRRPRARGQEGPARLRWSGGPSARGSRPGPAPSVSGGPAGTSSARRSRWTHLGVTFDVAGRRLDLVFPHHEMWRPRGAGGAAREQPSPRPTSTPGWSRSTARRCRSRRATCLRLGACAAARSTRWRSGWRCWPTTTAATGSGPTTSCGTRSTPWPTGVALALGAGLPRLRSSSGSCPPSRTTSTPRRPWPPCRSGWTPPSARAARGHERPGGRRGGAPGARRGSRPLALRTRCMASGAGGGRRAVGRAAYAGSRRGGA